MKRSLQRRSISAMLGLVALTVAAFGAMIWIASDRVEAVLLDTLVNRETDFLSDQIEHNSVVQLPESSQVRAWFSRGGHGHAPHDFARLPLGITHDVAFQDELYHVQRTALRDGVLTVAMDITALERRERQFQIAILAGGLLVVTLALAVGWWLSGHVAQPITRLSKELRAMPPEALDRRFALRYQDADTQVIAEALDRFIERVRQLLERERGFSAAASHEIRSPLTVIRGAVELALLDESLSAATRKALERAQRSSESLSFVMDSLFELARDDVSPAPADGCIDAVAIVNDTLESFSAEQTRRIVWEAPDSPVLLPVKEGHFSIIVRNLIDNALQHAPSGPVKISLDAQAFRVADSGPGIAAELLPHLFDQRQRGPHSLGAGLGLYIANQLALRMGARLLASNTPSGSLFQLQMST